MSAAIANERIATVKLRGRIARSGLAGSHATSTVQIGKFMPLDVHWSWNVRGLLEIWIHCLQFLVTLRSKYLCDALQNKLRQISSSKFSMAVTWTSRVPASPPVMAFLTCPYSLCYKQYVYKQTAEYLTAITDFPHRKKISSRKVAGLAQNRYWFQIVHRDS
jgi:hypothetical protein